MLTLNMKKNAKWIILILAIVILIIIIYYHHNETGTIIANFKDLPNYLPPDDIHFIKDPDISNILNPVSNFKLIDNDGKTIYINVFQHKKINIPPFTYRPLAQYCKSSTNPLTDSEKIDIMKNNEGLHIITSSPIIPISFENIWSSDESVQDDNTTKSIKIWHPIAQPGTVTMGDYITMSSINQINDELPCLPINLVVPSISSYNIIWSNSNSSRSSIYCWKATVFDFFRCSKTYDPSNMPEKDFIFDIPKNILKENTLQL